MQSTTVLKYSLLLCHPFFVVAALFALGFDCQIEWLLVKGIADFADGAELERWRSFASVMAASVAAHILSDPQVFSWWPHYEGKDCHTVCRLQLLFLTDGGPRYLHVTT